MENSHTLVLRERLTRINNQLIFLDMSCLTITAEDPKNFVEQPARRDKEATIKDIGFLEESVTYHLKRCLDGLNDGLQYTKQLPQESGDKLFIQLPNSISNQISFEFEAYVISFQKLIEEPTPQIIKAILKKEISKDFPLNNIGQKNIDGLYWRINALRNRSAHPDKPKYATKAGKSYQYMGLSSKCLPIEVNGNSIKIKCTLFDVAENQWVKSIIQSQIIEAPKEERTNKKELTDIIWPQRLPRGRGKNYPQLLFYDDQLELFDYVNSLPKLANSTLEYMETINHLFLRQLMTESRLIPDIKILTDEGITLSMQQLFSLE